MPTTVTIAASAGAVVNPNIYGHFAEHLGRCVYGGIWVGEGSNIPNDGGIRLDTVEALQRVNLPVLRWPGGCFADNYHWRDGIGPRESRPTRLNIWWLQGESNAFGTHEFMRFCRMIGTEPYVCANVGSGTVEEARSWLEYCNASQNTTLTRERAANGDPAPFNVKYWGVGNENWGCGGTMTAAQYALEYRKYATYLRQAGGPITLIACGSHGGNPEWDEQFLATLKGAEGLVDALALHNYSGWGMPAVDFTDDQYLNLLAGVSGMDAHIARAAALCRAASTADHKIKVIMDEWGTWFGDAKMEGGYCQPNTMQDAVFTGLSFQMFHRYAADLVMTNMAQTMNVLQALILTAGPKLCVTPTYWVYEMFQPHRGGAVRPVSVHGVGQTLADGRTVPGCGASVTEKDGALAISLVNTDFAAVDVTLTLADGTFGAVKRARVLAGDGLRAQNTPDAPDVVQPADLAVTSSPAGLRVTLPPASVAMIEVAI
jgi:alpha-N-arabinofuranosidase